MFKKILIANRGEIACRVIKTAKSLNIKTVTVFTANDQNSLHTQLSDEKVLITNYLDINNIIQAAKKTNSEAIHPGYGFLAENADFATKCHANNIVFIGPTPSAIAAMGNKARAKQIMQNAGIPIIPGYQGEDQDPNFLLNQAKKIGTPLLIKASLGGGGKGMRLVNDLAYFLDDLAACKREAKSSFNDDNMILEKYITNPRHVEVQIFADSHGSCVHLFARDCSIQRRQQKIIEESPAINIDPNIYITAIKAAKSINYLGAGTIEFLVDNNNKFYFMEMNTRLQVEHPITEKITGIDLVAWQLLVANNEKLPKTQADIKITGHAIELRIYSEDPTKFLPTTGKILAFEFPDDLRLDTGVQLNDKININYDPLIAKLIVHANSRKQAIEKLKEILENSFIAGITTNLNLLYKIINNKNYKNNNISTNFINDNHVDIIISQDNINDVIINVTCKTIISHRGIMANWRLNHNHSETITLLNHKKNYKQTIYLPLANFKPIKFFHMSCDNIYVNYNGLHYKFKLHTTDNHETTQEQHGNLNSPMPGIISKILVNVGQKVSKNQPLLIMEAMKMEHTIKSPHNGTINTIYYKIGDTIAEGVNLISLSAKEN